MSKSSSSAAVTAKSKAIVINRRRISSLKDIKNSVSLSRPPPLKKKINTIGMKKESKSVNSYFIYFTYYIEYLSRFQRYTNAFISSILCYIITIKSLLTLHSRGELCRVKTIEFIFVQIRIQYINISVCEVLQAT